MARQLSNRMLRATTAQESGEVWLPLVKLSHASWEDDIRLVPNGEAVEHDGEVYEDHAFDIALPDDAEDSTAVVQFVADAVDRVLTRQIRSVTDRITASVKWIALSDPETVEIEYPDLEIRTMAGDRSQVSGAITVEPILDEPFLSKRFTPQTAPGMF